jgi:hypothetical protein
MTILRPRPARGRSFVARLAANTLIAGARFHPGSAAEVLGLPVFVPLNQTVPLRLPGHLPTVLPRAARFKTMAKFEPMLEYAAR